MCIVRSVAICCVHSLLTATIQGFSFATQLTRRVEHLLLWRPSNVHSESRNCENRLVISADQHEQLRHLLQTGPADSEHFPLGIDAYIPSHEQSACMNG